ncbi:hypothetical protein ACKKBG_A07765 [Auxenochlorella protothecoides x Auxenochlorella symbiontica]
MSRPVALLLVHLVLLIVLAASPVAQADCDPRIGMFSLPTIEVGGTLYLVSRVDQGSFCRHHGYYKMGYSLPRRFENEPQLRPGKPFPFPISTYLPGMSKICTPTNDEPCYFYHFIECLPRGVKSCAKLWTSVDGMGTGNQGGVNWGNNNTGIKNRVSTTSADGVSTTSANDVPTTSTKEVPATSADRVSTTSANDVPTTSTKEVPATSADRVSTTSANDVPTTSTEEVPATSADRVSTTSAKEVSQPSSY